MWLELVGIIIFVFLSKYLYFILTIQTKEIYVTKIVNIILNGEQIYYLLDDNNQKYTYGFIPWIPFNDFDIKKIKENKIYKIRYYGLNMPYLNIYKKLIDAEMTDVINNTKHIKIIK